MAGTIRAAGRPQRRMVSVVGKRAAAPAPANETNGLEKAEVPGWLLLTESAFRERAWWPRFGA
jgi:hypothetical protein